jgi:hypothetical protein
MPKTGLTYDAQVETRNSFTKVDTKFQMIVDGKELPSMAVLAEALEAAIELFQTKIKDSYKVVPARVETPIAEPYAAKPLS